MCYMCYVFFSVIIPGYFPVLFLFAIFNKQSYTFDHVISKRTQIDGGTGMQPLAMQNMSRKRMTSILWHWQKVRQDWYVASDHVEHDSVRE